LYLFSQNKATRNDSFLKNFSKIIKKVTKSIQVNRKTRLQQSKKQNIEKKSKTFPKNGEKFFKKVLKLLEKFVII